MTCPWCGAHFTDDYEYGRHAFHCTYAPTPKRLVTR